LKPFIRDFGGKVRDVYDLGGDHFLMVATDRISTFDRVHPNGVPRKGAVLNQLSAFWFEKTAGLVPNHLIRVLDGTEGDLGFPVPLELVGCSMIVKKAARLDIECVARGYLSGSGWVDYQKTGSVCGIALPVGLVESDKLPGPIFTPATKAASGHDINISLEEAGAIVGEETALQLKELSLQLYEFGAGFAARRGVIIADTKFELGRLPDGKLILIDEMLTPDSSRFWDYATYQPGRVQESMDKQPVRDWAISTGWNKEDPAPALPLEVVEETTERYENIFFRLTGREVS
jgi:phosphoribosylaminoimidazole-succinocarboxamide synthase